jgi:tetratricopeptide (TPR) repeat protein
MTIRNTNALVADESLDELALSMLDGTILPAVELTPELLQKLLQSEFAAQAGEWQSAYATLLALARQTRDPRLARRAMEVALEAKQAPETLAAIRLWRDLAPKAEEPNHYFLRFIAFSDDLSEAQTLLRARLEKAAPHERGYVILQMQQILRYAKDKSAAFVVLEQLLAPYPEWIESRLALAQAAFLKGDTQRALREARAARAIKPASEEAVLTHVLLISDTRAAMKELQDYLAVYPKAYQVRMELARKMLDQHEYSKSRGEFELLLKSEPKNLSTLYVLGVVAMYEKDGVAAEKYFTGWLAASAENPGSDRDPGQVYSWLSQIAEERGDTEAALNWLIRMAGNDSRQNSQFNLQLRRAALMAKAGKLPEARAVLKALRADGTDEKVQVVMTEAQILRSANQPLQAFQVLEAGLKRFPNNHDLLYDYALAAEKLDRWQVMETALRQLMVLVPGEHNAYNALGYSLAERNIRLPEALVLIEKALKLAPDDPYIMDSLGWCQFRMGNLKESEQTLRRAYDLRADPEIAVHLGEVLWRKGQKDEAQKFWREAQSKDPKSDALKNTLVRFNVSLH